MRGTPGFDRRRFAMYGETFLPGSCPPSPALANHSVVADHWHVIVTLFQSRQMFQRCKINITPAASSEEHLAWRPAQS